LSQLHPEVKKPSLPDSHYITALDRTQRGNGGGHQQLQVSQRVRRSAENHQRDPSSDQILLIWHVLVGRDENIETSRFGSFQEAPILQARR
jgi:hypothetical protein